MIWTTLLVILLPLGYWAFSRHVPRAALFAMPFVCALLMLIGLLQESYVEIVSSLAILLITPLTILYHQDAQLWRSTLRWHGTLYFLFSIILVLHFMTLLVALAVLNWVELALGLLFISGIAVLALSIYRHSELQQSVACNVFSTLGTCIQQKLPLSTALDMAADTYRGYTAYVLRRINHWLSSGTTLTQALMHGYPQCPVFALASVATAEPVNQLAEAFESLRSDLQHTRSNRSLYRSEGGYLYPFAVLAIAGLITFGLMTFVMPQFASVLDEMTGGKEFPFTTQVLIGVTRWFTGDVGNLLLLIIIPLCIWVPLWGYYLRQRPRQPQHPHWSSRLGDLVKWNLPGIHWFEKTRSQLRATEQLRLALRAGIPINEAIAQAMLQDINDRYRKRLERWRVRVEGGENVAGAAKQTHVGHALAWAFNQDLHTGATPDILQVLETHYRVLYHHRLEVSRYIIIPATTLLVAGIVGFIALAFFTPMVQIIDTFVDLYP
jgi:protein transport protein HofC